MEPDVTTILVFDLETTMDHQKIHMVSWDYIQKLDTGEWVYGREDSSKVRYARLKNTFVAALPQEYLNTCAGHNIVAFDCPVLENVWKLRTPLQAQIDTLLLAQMLYPDNPGGHSLKALAHLVGEVKMDAPSFDEFSPEMVPYGKHDTFITAKLLCHLLNRWQAEEFDWKAYWLEVRVKQEVALMERNGFKLDIPKATLFAARLRDEVAEIEDQVKGTFYPQISAIKGAVKTNLEEVCSVDQVAQIAARYGITVPAAGPKSLYRVKPINLTSRQQLTARLIHAGWKPIKYTPISIQKYEASGNYSDLTPILDETTLEDSPIAEAKLLAKRFRLEKTLAFVEKWLELVQDDGRVHGRVMSIGAPTARMAHFNPNIAQTPKVGNPNGYECRDCWTVDEGLVLVGVDASGLELRCLAHYAQDKEMSYEILEGDIHTKNQEAVQLHSRDMAKTFIYGWLYGAGAAKLGAIAQKDADWGGKAKGRLLKRWPGINRLIKKIKSYADEGYIPGIDGRRLYIRKAHAALNTLLQGCGAIIMKQALVHCVDDLRAAGIWFRMVANVHDEFQMEVKPEDVNRVMEIAKASIVKAGVTLGLRVPLAGEAKSGPSWALTH